MIHATTGVLPPVTIAVPQHFVDAAFGNMRIIFTIGPLVSDMVTPEDAGADDPPALVMPRPSLKTGTWSWRQYDGADWAGFGVMQSVGTAQLSNVNPVIREGALQLSEALGTATPLPVRPPRR